MAVIFLSLKIFVKKKKDEESAILSRLIDPIVRSKQWKDKRGNIRKDFVLSAFALCANISIFDSRFYRSTSPLFHLYLSIIFDFYQISIIQIPLKILNERAIKRKKKKNPLLICNVTVHFAIFVKKIFNQLEKMHRVRIIRTLSPCLYINTCIVSVKYLIS